MDISRVSQFPRKEDDQFEFKSSRTLPEELKTKLACAVSGFANSGGGTIVAGVDDKTGDADGGLAVEKFVGRQPLTEWADQVIGCVAPTPRYHIKLVEDADGRGTIEAGKAVLVVSIEESHSGPHMAPTIVTTFVPAGIRSMLSISSLRQFRAMRHFSKPRMTHLIRQRPDDGEIIQIGLVTLTESPAIDIELAMEPLPGVYGQGCREFPVQIGVIDRNTPFFFDVSTREEIRRHPNDEFVLRAIFHDLALNAYTYQKTINLFRSVPSLRFFKKDLGDVVKSLDSIRQELAGRSDA